MTGLAPHRVPFERKKQNKTKHSKHKNGMEIPNDRKKTEGVELTTNGRSTCVKL